MWSSSATLAVASRRTLHTMPCCYQALIESDEGVMWSSSATLAVASRRTLQARVLDEKESSSAAWSSAAPAAAAPPFCRRLDAFCDATWNRMELMRTVGSVLFFGLAREAPAERRRGRGAARLRGRGVAILDGKRLANSRGHRRERVRGGRGSGGRRARPGCRRALLLIKHARLQSAPRSDRERGGGGPHDALV